MLVIGPRPKYFPFCGDLCSPPGSSLPSHYSSSISLTFFTWKPGSDTSAEFLSLKKPLTHQWSLPFPFYLRLVFYLLSLQNYASTAPTSLQTHASKMLIAKVIVSVFSSLKHRLRVEIFFPTAADMLALGLARSQLTTNILILVLALYPVTGHHILVFSETPVLPTPSSVSLLNCCETFVHNQGSSTTLPLRNTSNSPIKFGALTPRLPLSLPVSRKSDL